MEDSASKRREQNFNGSLVECQERHGAMLSDDSGAAMELRPPTVWIA